jgi:hypothetical protein
MLVPVLMTLLLAMPVFAVSGAQSDLNRSTRDWDTYAANDWGMAAIAASTSGV